ncbi:hypothetical protein, partial [Herbaspirillum sp. B65]
MSLAILSVLPMLARAADDVPATGAAQASDAPAAQDGSVKRLDSVVVTRKRSQSSAAVAGKEVEDRVMDSVTREQVERLPDSTVT